MRAYYLVVIGTLAHACAATAAWSQSSNSAADRRMLTGSFSTDARVESSQLRTPGMLATNGELVVVYDYGDRQLKAFDASGRPKWSGSGAGRAAPPLANPTDLRVTNAGDVWLLDAPTRRFALWKADGTPVRSTAVPRNVERFALAPDGRIWATDGRGKHMWYVFVPSGAVVDSVATPPYLEQVHLMAQEGYVAAAGDRRIAVAHRFAGAIGIWEPESKRVVSVPGIEPLPFGAVTQWKGPDGGTAMRVSASAPRGALGVTGDERSVYVLFAGTTPMAGRLIDRYDARTGAYTGTMLLPERAHRIARTRDGFWVLTRGDLAEIKHMTWKGQ